MFTLMLQAMTSNGSTPKRDLVEQGYSSEHYEQHLGHVLADVQSSALAQVQSSAARTPETHLKPASPLPQASGTQLSKHVYPFHFLPVTSQHHGHLAEVSQTHMARRKTETLTMQTVPSTSQACSNTMQGTTTVKMMAPRSGQRRSLSHIAEVLAAPAAPQQQIVGTTADRATSQKAPGMRLEQVAHLLSRQSLPSIHFHDPCGSSKGQDNCPLLNLTH